MTTARLCGVLALTAVIACQATSNPDRDELKAVAPAAKPASAAATPPAPAVAEGAAAPASAQVAPAAQAPAAPAPDLVLGQIGDGPVSAREFLRRLWVGDNGAAREVLEQIVFAHLATLEADRLGVLLTDSAVEVEVARAVAVLEKGLADKGSKLTLDEHIDRVIGVDPKLYRANLRADAIVQLLAARCVRGWMLESDRAVVRITELRDAQALAAARGALAAGDSFEQVALAHGAGEDEATHTTRMAIARNEAQELARLAFATPVGTVGGPLEQSGRWLLMAVDQRLDALGGGWAALREPVEKSLVEEHVSNAEFLQWRAAMTRRYRVDLEAFFDLVEPRAP